MESQREVEDLEETVAIPIIVIKRNFYRLAKTVWAGLLFFREGVLFAIWNV